MLHRVFYLIFVISGVEHLSGQEMDLSTILPTQVSAWHYKGHDQVFSRDNLYDYINGGAELYLSYGFNSLYNRIYESEDNPDIIVDIFDMGTAENAFGIFSHSREIIDTTFGQGSQYTAGLLLFWKDRYYVSILASPETPGSKEAVFSLGRIIDKKINSRGNPPQLLALLPWENLIEESIRFFHHHFWLNAHYFISDDNILLVDQDTDVILTKYKDKDRTPVCILIKYPSVMRADSARVNFVNNYLPLLAKKPVARFDDGSWCGIKQNKSILAIILNAGNETSVNKFLTSINWRDTE